MLQARLFRKLISARTKNRLSSLDMLFAKCILSICLPVSRRLLVDAGAMTSSLFTVTSYPTNDQSIGSWHMLCLDELHLFGMRRDEQPKRQCETRLSLDISTLRLANSGSQILGSILTLKLKSRNFGDEGSMFSFADSGSLEFTITSLLAMFVVSSIRLSKLSTE